MTALQHGAPAAPTERNYDPEIKDMADYVHNYSVNSDLAVWVHYPLFFVMNFINWRGDLVIQFALLEGSSSCIDLI